MPSDDKYKKLNNADEDSGDQTGGKTGAGGQAGHVEFKDFLSSAENLRDDLAPEEKRRLMAVHHELHHQLVKKQKDKRAYMQSLKEGKISLNQYRQNFADAAQGYAIHPLSRTAQFSGSRDPQVNEVPNQNQAETNDKKKEELQFRYNLAHRPESPKPKFHPKPTPK